MVGLAWSVGFDAADRLVVGPSECAGAIVAFDGEGGVRDVDGDGLASVDPAEGDLLADDHDDSAVGGPPLHPGGSGGGLGRGTCRAGTAQPDHFVGGERVGAGAQEFATFRMEKRQGGGVDADADATAAEDLGGEDDVLARRRCRCG
ncbi:hypothetical protein [Micromonospora sp. MH33]|uniref:hypothetical protein n=1 Tax=Micromonospora sp. MH33 TaxID=1945509 RepID=UPI0011B28DBC|nr:hypothetical protein [Micromonospora sp. MH33]